MVAVESEPDKLCPECGDFVKALSRRTGWCHDCTKLIENNLPYCGVCGRDKDPTGRCVYCDLEKYLRTNADHLEHYILLGNSLSKSVDLLAKAVRPTCASCGDFLNQARRTDIFCRKKPRCCKAVRRYKYLVYDKNMSRAEALATVLESINGSED